MKAIINGTYPKTNAYNVIYESGAGGNFFAGLLNLFATLSDKVPEKNQYTEPELPKLYDFYNVNHSILEKVYLTDDSVRYIVPKYKIAGPVNPLKPVVYYDHTMPDFDDFFNIFPLGKLFFLTATEEEEARIQGNFFFKVVCDPRNSDQFKKWISMCPDVTCETPDELTVEDSFKILRDPTKLIHYSVRFRPFVAPEQHADKIFQFRVKDIYNSKNEVLQRLSAITDKPVTQAMHDYYDRYLELQQELVQTKMPWVTV